MPGCSIGWCPAALRSMIDRRRWPRSASLSCHTPASSGPRCASSSTAASNVALWCARFGPIQPTIPHILGQVLADAGGAAQQRPYYVVRMAMGEEQTETTCTIPGYDRAWQLTSLPDAAIDMRLRVLFLTPNPVEAAN